MAKEASVIEAIELVLYLLAMTRRTFLVAALALLLPISVLASPAPVLRCAPRYELTIHGQAGVERIAPTASTITEAEARELLAVMTPLGHGRYAVTGADLGAMFPGMVYVLEVRTD